MLRLSRFGAFELRQVQERPNEDKSSAWGRPDFKIQIGIISTWRCHIGWRCHCKHKFETVFLENYANKFVISGVCWRAQVLIRSPQCGHLQRTTRFELVSRRHISMQFLVLVDGFSKQFHVTTLCSFIPGMPGARPHCCANIPTSTIISYFETTNPPTTHFHR